MTLYRLVGYPLRGNHSVCDFYEISENDLNYYHYQPGSNNIIVYANTSRTHAPTHVCTYARALAHPPPSLFDGSVRPTMTTELTPPFRRWRDNVLSVLHSNKQRTGDSAFAIVYGFFCVYKMLGRTETRTRDRMYCRTIRTVRDISRDNRARIATCSLRTPTDLL